MGVDTRLYISHNWSIEDIKDVLKARFGYNIYLLFTENAPQYVRLVFDTAKGARQVNVHTDSALGGFQAIQLNMGSDEESQKILKVLAHTFGGFYQEADGDNNFGAFRYPADGDVDWIVKQALNITRI